MKKIGAFSNNFQFGEKIALSRFILTNVLNTHEIIKHLNIQDWVSRKLEIEIWESRPEE
jgi:hypothetical protein